MALYLGDPPNVDGDPIVTKSELDKWKRRSVVLAIFSIIQSIVSFALSQGILTAPKVI